MNYSQNYFGKTLNELTWQDIETYFAEAKEETETIEYKSFVGKELQDSHYEGIFKAACALLNSNGGIIIWGSPVGVKVAEKKEKSFKGALSPLNLILEKDRVISKVSGKITPMPNGINAKIIESGTNCICVFEIQKSQYSPHQTDNKYYMRLDGQSVPAPHYFIEAMFRQIKYPDIEGFLKIDNIALATGQPVRYLLSLTTYIFNWSTLQNETNVHFNLTTDLGKFLHNGNPSTTEKYYNGAKMVHCKSFVDILHYGGPISKSLTIEIPLQQIPGEINLMLHFGGKNSPMKSSEYKYKIVIPPGLNDLLECEEVERIENRYMHELPQSITISKEEKLRITLGR